MSMNGHLPTIIQGVFGVGIIGFVWKIAADNAKATDTIFRRFDEYKETVKREHVTKDVCGLVQQNVLNKIEQNSNTLTEIKADVKELVTAKRNGG